MLIVDEAQGLKAPVLDTIRGLWDRGDLARGGEENQPAFGCVLVGNDSFVSRYGHLRSAGFRPLLSRVTHDMNLPRPSSAEFRILAHALAPHDERLSELLAEFGEAQGNLRVMDVAFRQARLAAQGEPINAAHIRGAMLGMGVR